MNPLQRTLAACALAGAAALTSGCIIVADDGVSPGDPLNAQLSLTWTVQVAGSTSPFDCHDSGANSIVVEARNLDTDDVYVDIWDCGDGEGVSQTVVAGDYDVTVALAACDASGTCLNPMVSEAVGVVAIFEDGVYDLGDFTFLVD